MIKVLFFAQLADLAQQDSASLDYTTGITPRGLVVLMEGKLPKELIDALRFDAVMVSINQVFAGWDQPLNDGDELAFLPPFSGG